MLEYSVPAFPLTSVDSTVSDTNVCYSTKELGEINPSLPDEWSILPFLCLPDGAHAVESEEFIYFHLPPVSAWAPHINSSLFGLACFRQMDSNDLINKPKEVTRSSVQKAVVVLARHPILGSLRTKLGLVTHAFFQQKDFEKREILDGFYQSIRTSGLGYIPDSILYMAFSLRELVQRFKTKTLQLFKLILLEKRILFFGQRVEKLSAFQYALISLIPGLLRSLGDAASPKLSSNENICTPTNDPDHQKLEKMGLPLRIFGEGSFFQPYIPLQQIDILMSPTTHSFIVGTSNSIFTHHKSCNIDVVVNVDTGTVEISDTALNSILILTPADRKFIDNISRSVIATYADEDDPSMNSQIQFEGSDEDIRDHFARYLLALMKSILSTQNTLSDIVASDTDSPNKDYISDFNVSFVKSWQTTKNFSEWSEKVIDSTEAFAIFQPGHPNAGASALISMQLNLAARLHEMGLDKTFFVARNEVAKALNGAEKAVRELTDTKNA
ncbi:late secretory pathway protein avl9, partial [Nowakowskiella sp. JEL0078]